jgi:GR25 family glycosyltransferase involved in LPS biosynthesis
MTKIINIIVIYTKSLSNRTQYINSTLTFLKNLCEKYNLKVNIILVDSPNNSDILNDSEKYNKRVNYDKIENCEYNNNIIPLNPNQISNIEKQRNALLKVKDNEYNLILEDDVIISKDYIDNIEILIKNINILENLDILITSDFIYNENKNMELLSFNEYDKILISKSSYLINKKTADKLFESTDIFKYDYKVSLTKFLKNNKDNIDSKILNKCIFLEGSKVGIFGSSLKNKNFLSQNSQYIELAKLVNLNIIDDDIIKNATDIYKLLENLENPEIDHIYGLVYYKSNDINNAKKYLNRAIINMKKNNNYCSKSNEILNNAINIYKLDQEFFEECKNLKSKYS